MAGCSQAAVPDMPLPGNKVQCQEGGQGIRKCREETPQNQERLTVTSGSEHVACASSGGSKRARTVVKPMAKSTCPYWMQQRFFDVSVAASSFTVGSFCWWLISSAVTGFV